MFLQVGARACASARVSSRACKANRSSNRAPKEHEKPHVDQTVQSLLQSQAVAAREAVASVHAHAHRQEDRRQKCTHLRHGHGLQFRFMPAVWMPRAIEESVHGSGSNVEQEHDVTQGVTVLSTRCQLDSCILPTISPRHSPLLCNMRWQPRQASRSIRQLTRAHIFPTRRRFWSFFRT
eukprot:561277-Rhodomonas_salina.1